MACSGPTTSGPRSPLTNADRAYFRQHHRWPVNCATEIATVLDLGPSRDTCVVRQRVRYIDGEPAIISDDYFDLRIVAGTELAEPADTTREDVLKEAGYEQTYDIDEIITRMPTPDETARLSIPAGTPVAEHRRIGCTADDRAVRVMVSIIPGDTLILRYVVPT